MQKRIAAYYAVTREQKRQVAKNRALKQGNRRICSKGKHRNGSWFADHWREFAEKR